MRVRMQSVEFRLGRIVRYIVNAHLWLVYEVIGVRMFFILIGLFGLGFLLVTVLNMSAFLAFVTAFGIYLATGGWRPLRIFALTVSRDLRSALFVLIPLTYNVKKNLRARTTIPRIFKKTVLSYPNKSCFLFKDENWTFSDVNVYTNKVANSLLDAGYQKGDVVAIFMENSPQMVALWLGLSKIGAVGALINFNLRDMPLSHCIKIANAKAVIFGGNLHEAVADVRSSLPGHLSYLYIGSPDASPDFPCDSFDSMLDRSSVHDPPDLDCSCLESLFYIYTSGTTGLPKAAKITHLRFFYMVYAIGCFMKITKKDVIYTALPLYHSAGGILGVGQAIVSGTTVAIRQKFSASQFWTDCIKYKATAAQYIGEICRYLLAQPHRPEESSHSVRVVYGNGIKPQIWTQFQDRFKVKLIGEFYGATEGNCNIVNAENRVGAVGFTSRILPFVYPVTLIKVNPETNELVRDKNGVCVKAQPGEPGELIGKIVKSNPIRQFDGYVDDSATSKKILQDVFTKGDFAFSSGDILVMDELGFYYFRDRTGDTFKWRGENVSTSEVEAIISNAIKLNDAVVYGVEVPGCEGKAGMAAIVDESGSINVDLLSQTFQRSLPSYAKPMFLRFVKEADMTGTFKLKKVKLRDEGIDPTRVKDRMFYFENSARTYLPLTQDIYQGIISGTIRI